MSQWRSTTSTLKPSSRRNSSKKRDHSESSIRQIWGLNPLREKNGSLRPIDNRSKGPHKTTHGQGEATSQHSHRGQQTLRHEVPQTDRERVNPLRVHGNCSLLFEPMEVDHLNLEPKLAAELFEPHELLLAEDETEHRTRKQEPVIYIYRLSLSLSLPPLSLSLLSESSSLKTRQNTKQENDTSIYIRTSIYIYLSIYPSIYISSSLKTRLETEQEQRSR